MWFIQCHHLIFCLGVCFFIMGAFLETVETRGIMKGGNQRNDRMDRQKSRLKARKKKDNRKSSKTQKRQKLPSKPTKGKPQTGSDTKISVYNCPDEAVEMNCLSCKTKVYRKCPIAGANKITQVQIMREYSSSYDKCNVGRKKNFGVLDDSNIWVDAGCRANFLVCYEKGKHEPKTIECKCTTKKKRCPTGLHGLRLNIDIKVSMLWRYSGNCKENQTWGYQNDDIWVDRGCSGVFRVVW